MQPSDTLNENHWKNLREHYSQGEALPWTSRCYRDLLAKYFNFLIREDASVYEVGTGSGYLLSKLRGSKKAGCDVCPEQVERSSRFVAGAEISCSAGEELEAASAENAPDYFVLADTVNESPDVQALFTALRGRAKEDTRMLFCFMNSLWRPLLSLARRLGLRVAVPEQNWLAPVDVRALLELSDWELVHGQSRVLFPVSFPGSKFLNRVLSPLLSPLCLTHIYCARPRVRERREAGVTVIIPARNEAGNIEAAIRRMPAMGTHVEILFVEGGSSDNTWEEIQRVKEAYPQHDIRCMKQAGKGKGDAVRLGYARATQEILMILDADLTMPPEDLPKFYEALASGKAEFANGVRLVYPMEGEAMRFLNLCANKFFAIAFSWLLGQPVKDTLCGTKVLTQESYRRIAANRSYFGDFDPFGDFDLLFGAAKLNLKILDVPIRYRNRTYGSTNINRWRDGQLLFRMMFYAATKLKFL